MLGQRRAGEPSPLEGITPSPPAHRLYIHIPFCFHRCHYCDFYSIVDNRDRQGAFTDRLVRELDALAPLAGPLRSIFVGGGTPTLLAPPLWERLLAHLRDRFDLSLIDAGSGEFTVECNPETATSELFAILRTGGVNRLSIGAQSFNTSHLETLERWHDPLNVPKALELGEQAGIPHRSIDLIYAIPGQTLNDWRADLEAAIALPIDHVSAYNLTYEPNTAMTARLRAGQFTPTDEDLEIEMFELTGALLRDAGFDRYEVSNYARAGGECEHNLGYWRQDQWHAAGPSASGHFGGHRWKNVPRLDDYLAPTDSGLPPVIDHEPPDAHRALAERIMTGLRLREGLDGESILADADPLSVRAALELEVQRQIDEGAIELRDGRWVLTERAWLIADGVAGDLMSATTPPSRED